MPRRATRVMAAGTALVARVQRQWIPASANAYPTITASRNPTYQKTSSSERRLPRSWAGMNSASMGAPIEYSAPTAMPRTKRRENRTHPSETRAWATPAMRKITRSSRNILCRP